MGKKLRWAGAVGGLAGAACFVAGATTSVAVFWAFGVLGFLILSGTLVLVRLPSR
jgi:hypothetical protein